MSQTPRGAEDIQNQLDMNNDEILRVLAKDLRNLRSMHNNYVEGMKNGFYNLRVHLHEVLMEMLDEKCDKMGDTMQANAKTSFGRRKL